MQSRDWEGEALLFVRCNRREQTMREEGWLVLHVVANHEKRVAQHLATRSMEHFLPLYRDESRWTDRTVILERPLFPGYVFVRFPPALRLAALTVPGVLSLLGSRHGGTVAPSEINAIRAALLQGYPVKPHPPVTVGTHVRIRSGIFADFRGIVAELRSRCKVVVALSPLERCFSVETDVESLDISHTGQSPPVTGTVRSGSSHRVPGK